MPTFNDLSGQTFGRLTVVEPSRNDKGKITWICTCSCGGSIEVEPIRLRLGKTKSCGCLRSETTRVKNAAKTKQDARKRNPLYYRWASMLQRCENPKNPAYHNYGARGIKVCDRWREDFANYMQDVGAPPTSNHTLDRIDNDGDYSPENCRWAESKEQLRNQRRSIFITVEGVTKHAKEWSEEPNISYQTLTKMFRRGGVELATEYVAAHL